MSSTLTFAPIPATIPTPSRKTDLFDFLHAERVELPSEEFVTVRENQAGDLVQVTIARPDGRSLSRKVPASSWQEESYRCALIRSMSTLLA
jgi:hypothetical protein